MQYHDSTNRAELRKTLLDNGYIPLPLDGKQIFEPGWTRAEIDADWLVVVQSVVVPLDWRGRRPGY